MGFLALFFFRMIAGRRAAIAIGAGVACSR
jgi:hypothetical protein